MSLQFHIPSIVCEGCADTLTKTIQALDADALVNVDLASKTLSVTSTCPTEAIQAAIVAKGHTLGA